MITSLLIVDAPTLLMTLFNDLRRCNRLRWFPYSVSFLLPMETKRERRATDRIAVTD
jgi:hypothetical protein